MQDRPGASAAEWAHFSLLLGLGADLLPVVSRRDATISPRSTLKTLGKVPSRYDAQGQVVGIAKWTEVHATEAQLNTWSRHHDYGICLQTRSVLAFDLDVDPVGCVAAIRARISERLGLPRGLPGRARAGSARIALAFECAEPMEKRVVRLRDGAGIVELLGAGNQFVVAGTHPSGGRYFWEGGLPFEFPLVTRADVNACLAALDAEFGDGTYAERYAARDSEFDRRDRAGTLAPVDDGAADGRARSARHAGAGDAGAVGAAGRGDAGDPVVDWLERRGWAHGHGRDGESLIYCPWSEDHTMDSGPTQTVYWPAGTGGYALGHFKCLHAHCEGKTDAQFLEAVGYRFADVEAFEVLPAAQKAPRSNGISALTELGVGQAGDVVRIEMVGRSPAVWSSEVPGESLRRGKKGWLATLENVAHALSTPGWWREWAYDAFLGTVVWRSWGEASSWRPLTDADLRAGRVALEQAGFEPVGRELMSDAVHHLAWGSRFDSAQDWLDGLRWDGVARIGAFLRTYYAAREPHEDFEAAEADNPKITAASYLQAVSLYWWSAMAGRVLDPGCQADMVPILIGDEGIGKTRGLEALAPWSGAYVTINLAERDADLSRRMRGRLIAEIGELRGLHTRERESILGYISERADTWVPKWQEFATEAPRRCLFVGTGNPKPGGLFEGLDGDRRWLPVMVGAVDRAALARDREQLWAEAAVLWQVHGVMWQEAQRLGRAARGSFLIADEMDEPIAQWIDQTYEKYKTEGFSLSELALGIGLDPRKLTHVESLRMGRLLRIFGCEKRNAKRAGRVFKRWFVISAHEGSPSA